VSGTQRTLRLGQPVWLRDGASVKRRYPRLSGKHDTSVAIVGGGMTGALVAHAFASAGVSTILLEGVVVANGSTAASSALLLQEPDLELKELASRYGSHASRRIWQLSHESVHQLVAFLKRFRIRCDSKSRDAVYYATDTPSVTRLHREFELRTRSGLAGKWLGPGDLRRMTGIPGRGAIQSHGSAQFDPYRACVGVLGAAPCTRMIGTSTVPLVPMVAAGIFDGALYYRLNLVYVRC
jgi:glycine/D-amino acid oxidase-like deaminating enzyme